MAGPQRSDDCSASEPPIAPIHRVPHTTIVSIEHPCIIQNFDNGFKSLGGEAQIKHVLEHNIGDGETKINNKKILPEPVVGVSLRPNDPFARKLASTGVETRNVLVKVTIPKRTGRKRKRRSEGPFANQAESLPNSNPITAQQLLERLRDNQDHYRVEAVGMINATHRFRRLPDFQMRAADLPIMRELRTQVMEPDYDKLKDFYLDTRLGSRDITTFPAPPDFVQLDQPYRYEYKQVDGLIWDKDEHGNHVSANVWTVPRRQLEQIQPDATEIPLKPPPEIKAGNANSESVRQAVVRLKKLLDRRPIVSRRVGMNLLPGVSDAVYKEATQFVGYSFRKGPFRDCLIKFGVDPRSDPSYRIYQILMFQLDKDFKIPGTKVRLSQSSQTSREPTDSHVFDGKHGHAGGKIWQVCDVTDPLIEEVLNTSELRAECDVHQWGWYYSGTLSKARVIMRDKLRCLLTGLPPQEEDYRIICTIPNKITKSNIAQAQLFEPAYSRSVAQLSLDVRNMSRMGSFVRRSKGLVPENDDDGALDPEELESRSGRDEEERVAAAEAEEEGEDDDHEEQNASEVETQEVDETVL